MGSYPSNYIMDIPFNTLKDSVTDDWEKDIVRIFQAAPKEVKDFVSYEHNQDGHIYHAGLIPTFKTINLYEFSRLPNYSDHLGPHIRNVILNALRIVEAIPTLFTVKDILILTTAAFIHDMAQFNPRVKKGRDTEEFSESLQDIFELFIERWNKMFNQCISSRNMIKDLKYEINSLGSIFGEKRKYTEFYYTVLAVALYHPKHMPFDKKYKTRFEKLKMNRKFKKILQNRTIHEETLVDFLKRIKKEKRLQIDNAYINHIKFLAAVFQLADGFDIQQNRISSDENLALRLIYIEYNKSRQKIVQEYLNALRHYLNDYIIKNVDISPTTSPTGSKVITVNFHIDDRILQCICKTENNKELSEYKGCDEKGKLGEECKEDRLAQFIESVKRTLESSQRGNKKQLNKKQVERIENEILHKLAIKVIRERLKAIKSDLELEVALTKRIFKGKGITIKINIDGYKECVPSQNTQ